MFRIFFFSALSLVASVRAAEVVRVPDGAGREWAFGSGGALVGEAKDGGWISLLGIGVGSEKFDAVVEGVEESEGIWEGVWQGRAGGADVERRYRLDKARGVLMVVDSFGVSGGDDGGVQIAYSGLWPVKEVTVFTESGRSAEEGFGRGDQGLVVPGRYGDVGLVVAGESPRVKPELGRDSANRAVWGFVLPEGEHSVVQVLALGKKSEGSVVLSRALSGGKITGGVGLDLEGVGELANFSLAEVRGEDLPDSPRAGMLVALDEFASTMGIVRGAEDYLLVSEGSLLSGMIGLGELRVRGALGETAVSPDEVVGIRGGAGRGRVEKVYLRDGRVLAGEVEGKPLALEGGGGWSISAAVDDFEGAVLALGRSDGELPDGVTGVVELHSGDVGFLFGGGSVLPVVTPWGSADVALDQVAAFVSGADGLLGGWLLLGDGSRVEIFVGEGTLMVGATEVALSQLRGFWRPGEEAPLAEDEWADTPEADEIELDEGWPETGGAWLVGGSRMAGRLGSDVITLVGATGTTDIETSKILSLKGDPGSGEGTDRFVVEIEGGAVFKGRVAGGVLEFSSLLGNWRLPAHDVVAYLKR